jgi:hypothetical protein
MSIRLAWHSNLSLASMNRQDQVANLLIIVSGILSNDERVFRMSFLGIAQIDRQDFELKESEKEK